MLSKDGPDIRSFGASGVTQLQFVVALNRFVSPFIRPTYISVRMADGREAYGKLRPVRRPWF